MADKHHEGFSDKQQQNEVADALRVEFDWHTKYGRDDRADQVADYLTSIGEDDPRKSKAQRRPAGAAAQTRGE